MNKDLCANHVSYFVILPTGLQFSHACVRSRAAREGSGELTNLLTAKNLNSEATSAKTWHWLVPLRKAVTYVSEPISTHHYSGRVLWTAINIQPLLLKAIHS